MSAVRGRLPAPWGRTLAVAALFALLAPTAGLLANGQLAGWSPDHGHLGSPARIATHAHPYDDHHGASRLAPFAHPPNPVRVPGEAMQRKQMLLLGLSVVAAIFVVACSDDGNDESSHTGPDNGDILAALATLDAASVAGSLGVFAAVVLAISGSPHSHGGQLLTNPLPGDLESIARGGELYRANCTSCHGAGGRGDGPLAVTLSPPPADLARHIPLHPEGDTYIFIANGFPHTAMPAWAETLTELEIWDLVNFLRDEFAE